MTEPSRLGPYELLTPIGRGGMGEVYRARDPRLGRDVAIKILPGHLHGHVDALSRLEREARSIAALSHPNVVTVFDVGADTRSPYIVMELLEGETLRQRLERGAIGGDELFDIALQVAAGLGAAHDGGISHRDLKPENVFLTATRQVKLLDFGVARAMRTAGPSAPAATTLETMAGTIVGTAAYMSPEQVRGELVDARSDQFAFGSVLHEMATGRAPFLRATAIESMAAVLNEEPPPLPVGDRLAVALAPVVRRCLAKRPDERFPTTVDLVAALQHARQEATSHARATPAPMAAPTRSIAVLPFANLSGDPANEYLGDGIAGEILATMSRLSGIKVVGRASSFQFKGQSPDLREVGQRLGVSHLVEGAVQRKGDEVRITATLVDAASGYQVWSERFDRRLVDMFAVEDEISLAVARALDLRFRSAEAARTDPVRSVNPLAHDAYLRGTALGMMTTYASMLSALEQFERAVAIDPGYAEAYAAISDAYHKLADGWLAPREVIPRALAAARKAVELDPALADGYAALGSHWQWDLDYGSARGNLAKAFSLDPNNTMALVNHAMYLSTAEGRALEALEEMQRVQALDPLNAEPVWIACVCLLMLGQFARALEVADKVERLTPNFFYYDSLHGMALRNLGRFAEAAERYRRIAAIRDGEPLFGLAVCEARLGHEDEARRILDRLLIRARDHYVPPDQIALVHAALGENDEAFAAIDRAFDAQSAWLPCGVRCLPEFELLAADRRMEALFTRLALPDDGRNIRWRAG